MEQHDLMTADEAQAVRAAAAILRAIATRATEYERLHAVDALGAAHLGIVRGACDAADDAVFNALNCAATYGGNEHADAVTDDWRGKRAAK